jgi:hypothetical protein
MVHSVLQSELQPEVEAFVPFKRPLVRGTQGRYRPPGKYLMPLQRHASSRAPHSTRALCLPCPATRGSRPWPFIMGRHTGPRTQKISSLPGVLVGSGSSPMAWLRSCHQCNPPHQTNTKQTAPIKERISARAKGPWFLAMAHG